MPRRDRQKTRTSRVIYLVSDQEYEDSRPVRAFDNEHSARRFAEERQRQIDADAATRQFTIARWVVVQQVHLIERETA